MYLNLNQCRALKGKISFITVNGDWSYLFKLLEDLRLNIIKVYTMRSLPGEISADGYERCLCSTRFYNFLLIT